MTITEATIQNEKLAAIDSLERDLKRMGVDLQLSDNGRRLLTQPGVLDQVSTYLFSMNDAHSWAN